MNCPKCGKEMQEGFLQTGGLVAFNKKRHKISLNPRDAEDVMIARKTVAGNDFAGYICGECGIVAFSYEKS